MKWQANTLICSQTNLGEKKKNRRAETPREEVRIEKFSQALQGRVQQSLEVAKTRWCFFHLAKLAPKKKKEPSSQKPAKFASE